MTRYVFKMPDLGEGTVEAEVVAWHIKVGDTIQVKVLKFDREKERISLGLKQLTPDPWDKAILDRYKVGQDETVKVTKVADFGAFVELEHGIEGLIPSSEMMKDAPALKEGDEMTARVIKVDKGERKIALSVKALHKDKDKAPNNDNDRTTLKDYMSQQEKPDTTIGALLKERS